MIRSSKALFLTLALSLLGAAFAGNASAALFHSEAEPTSIQTTATSSHVFSTPPLTVECESATWGFTMGTKTAESLTVQPGYGLCRGTMFGATGPVVLNFNGCDYTLFASGSQAIVCPAGKAIEFQVEFCKVTIPGQTLGTVSYANNAKHIDMTWNLSGISYSTSGFLCGTTSGTEGTYKGSSTAKGKNSGGTEVKIWHE